MSDCRAGAASAPWCTRSRGGRPDRRDLPAELRRAARRCAGRVPAGDDDRGRAGRRPAADLRPRSVRWPATAGCPTSASPTGSPSWASSSRWPAVIIRAASRCCPGSGAAAAPASAAGRSAGRLPRSARPPGLAEQIAARLPDRQHRRGAPGPAPPETPRYLVVDYKTNWLGAVDGRRADRCGDYTPARMAEAMMQRALPAAGAALLGRRCTGMLRWRQPDYDPTPPRRRALPVRPRDGRAGHARVDGVPCGVFSWRPPPALVVDCPICSTADGADR